MSTVVTLAGCFSSQPVDDPGEAVGGSPPEAAEAVHRWFEEARTGMGDRGWTLLFPYVRTDIIGSELTYRRAVDAADWNQVRYEITGVRLQDGEFRVDVRVEGGQDALPEFMLDWSLIQFARTDGIVNETGLMTVRIDPFPWGSSGIQAVGGSGGLPSADLVHPSSGPRHQPAMSGAA